MRPAGVELDRLADPADIKRPDSVLWEVFKVHRELGLDDPLDTAETEFGPVEQARMRCIINEELGWGDSGLAISLGVAGMHKMFSPDVGPSGADRALLPAGL